MLLRLFKVVAALGPALQIKVWQQSIAGKAVDYLIELFLARLTYCKVPSMVRVREL